MARTFAQLPGYDIQARIGRGAGAVIYSAREYLTRREVSIKHVVRHGPEDDRFLEQAEIEYDVATKLDHPALRKCFDIVRIRRWLKTAELYLVMEWVDGVRLEDHRPTAVERMLPVFLEIADGLSAMHRFGYVHADMKPNNVLLLRNARGLKLIDFGQSCPIGHTKTRIQGTPDFMAPEQVLRQPLDQRTDVFNFGATMYWTTTGKWFKTLMNKGETGVKKIEIDLRSDNAPPNTINPKVPPPLSSLIMECCENNKADRPREMRDVRHRLELIQHMVHKRLGTHGGKPGGKDRDSRE
ncbi:MAG: serine/threonine protein kinase [Planctomycetes bacterium]|nr:serine/threonine protein kinase [Planctomycetota bacterium]